MKKAVIVAAKRTAIGKVGGMFRHIPPEKLAAHVLNSLIDEGGIEKNMVDDVILGNVIGPGGNIARLSLLEADFPVEVAGVTIDRQCGSGLEAIDMACQKVQSGAGDILLAGGVESSSLAPWKLAKPETLYQAPTLYTRAQFSPEPIGDPDMGISADKVAEKFNVSRIEQDEYAFDSHMKAIAAIKNGRFTNEIVDVLGLHEDECPRANINMKKLMRLPPYFSKDGTVTIGNACPVNDGAAGVLVMSEEKCEELGLRPLAKFIDESCMGVDPNLAGMGPIPAVERLFERTNVRVKDTDVVEFNEAFAAQTIASLKTLDIPFEKVNLGGGALALGHPYGASGAILVTRLCHELMQMDDGLGLATMGIGGGLGIAALFERVV